MPHRCDAKRHRRAVEEHNPLATVGRANENELRKSIPEITERMLLRHLRDMTVAGILERHQEQGLPLRVRYSLWRRSAKNERLESWLRYRQRSLSGFW